MSDTGKQAICTDKAPGPVGPYSQAVVSGSLVFISGQLGIDLTTNTLAESLQEQTRLSLDNLCAIVRESGGDMSDVLKTTILLSDMNDFAEVNRIYSSFFEEPYPARAAYQVAKLPLNAMIEIEAVARLKER